MQDTPSPEAIHERRILLMFLGIILRVFRIKVSPCNVYITDQFQTTSAQGDCENIKEETLKNFDLITSKNSTSGYCMSWEITEYSVQKVSSQ
jgi:hypothetical protein